MESWEMLIDFGLIAGMFFIFLLIFFLIKSGKDITRILLIVLFSNALFFLFYYYGYLHRSRLIGAIAVFFGHGVGYLLGPVLLFLLKSLVLPQKKIILPLLKNLVPFFVVFVCFNIPLSVAMATDYLTPFHHFYIRIEPYFNLLENGFLATYIIITLNFFAKLKSVFKENYSILEKNDLNWYRQLIIGLFIIITIDSFCTIYEMFFPEIPWNIGTVIAFLFVGFYLYLGYKGMFQSRILMPDFLLQKIENDNTINSDDHLNNEIDQIAENPEKNSSIKQLDIFSKEEIDSIKEKLNRVLEIDKIFLNDELNLTDLSDSIGISNKKLSELLNQHLNTNFYNLINDHRIAEVIKKFEEGDTSKFTIMSIANDCGFQSKASFYRIFKQKTGVSPSEFIKNKKIKKEAV
ncbi:AraC-type DNA-binding protein [Epilithonimonas hungarica]|uniref:AraC-type DNA-binding protein n=2 Tax=Epilithonimonas hungarica TaxID=454006 RepID=A0A1G7N3A5_9FLAO|nr:AraC-type DNA-binding protein [Epilithonimonas hungarica]